MSDRSSELGLFERNSTARQTVHSKFTAATSKETLGSAVKKLLTLSSRCFFVSLAKNIVGRVHSRLNSITNCHYVYS
jgi:hypothetical protein